MTNICQKTVLNEEVTECAVVNPSSSWGTCTSYTDKLNVSSEMEVRNNTKFPIKDIVFSCNQIAPSGTVLRVNEETTFLKWEPNEIKTLKLTFLKHRQVASLVCKTKGWQ